MTVSAPGRHTVEYRGTNAAGTTEVKSVTFTIGSVTDTPGNVGGSVPATLSLALGAPASFGRVHAGRHEGLHGVDGGDRDLLGR